MTTKLSWTPTLRDDTYCSPACGMGCTWEMYITAQRAAAELAAQLGDGWHVRVWENMGWFYEVISPCGRLHVRHNGIGDPSIAYSAGLGDPADPLPGSIIPYGNGPTPQAAIADVVARACAQRDLWTRLTDGLAPRA